MAKLRNKRGGTARILVILAVLILIMVGILMIPSWKAFRFKSECIACEQAMKTAGDGLKIEFLDTFDEESINQARKTIGEVMPAREDICPSHGNVYLIKNEQGIFEPVCGLHNSDERRRTRLNSVYSGEKLEEARKDMLEKAEEDDPEPEAITIKVNGKSLECVYVSEEPDIRRGTSSTEGYEGVVAFYSIDDKGRMSYFLYADENYCAVWHRGDGWTGTAYED